MSLGSKPAEAVPSIIRELLEKSGGERYGLTVASFEVILEAVAAKVRHHEELLRKLSRPAAKRTR